VITQPAVPGLVRPAIAVLAVALALGGCGQGSQPGGQSPSSQGSLSASSASARNSSEIATQVIDWYIPATGAELANGALFLGRMKAYRQNALATCMAQYGFTLSRVSAEVIAANFADNGDFPDLQWIKSNSAFSQQDLHPPTAQPGKGATSAPGAAEQADLKRCLSSTKDPFAEVDTAGKALQEQWSNIWQKIQISPDVMAKQKGFTTCVQKEGVPADHAGDFGHFLVWVDSQAMSASSPQGVAAVDKKWAPVFVRCAGETVALREKLQLAAKKTFVQEHYQQIQALTASSAAAVAKADAENAG